MILLRYLIRDIFSHTLSVSLIFLFISFSSRSIQYLEEVVKGNLESETVLWLVLLRMPEFLEIIIPFSFFIAILLVVGRLYSQGEYVILQQNGLSTLNIWALVLLRSISNRFVPIKPQPPVIKILLSRNILKRFNM